jgi:maltose O-acetyltransferase
VTPPAPAGRSLLRRSDLRLLVEELRLDARVFRRDLWFNRVAASFAVPKALRRTLYRLGGMAVDSFVVSPACRFEGDPRNVRIGARSYLNLQCFVEAVAPVEIGVDCAVGMQTMIITSDHRGPGGTWRSQARGLPVVIGDRVWLGARVTVLPGVTIGDDVVVAAGAVVAADCLPHGVYAGVPARRVREVDPSRTRAREGTA